MIIAIDFDGTIVDHAYPDIGRPVPGAIDAMKRFNELGGKIILFTMRHNNKRWVLKEAVEYLRDAGVELWAVNNNPEQHKWSESRKVYAEVYIDDAAYGCPLIQIPGFNRLCVDWGVVEAGICAELLRRLEDGGRRKH